MLNLFIKRKVNYKKILANPDRWRDKKIERERQCEKEKNRETDKERERARDRGRQIKIEKERVKR